MKIQRNQPCPCGSGKKYKHCCIHNKDKQQSDIHDEIAHILAMNPNLTIDELNLVLASKMEKINNQSNPDFCGLSPTQMQNWLNAPFAEKVAVQISAPDDLSSSPVMEYLRLIVEEAMQNEGKFKATSAGNLPTKIVKQASELLPNFAVSVHNTHPSICHYTGSNETKFNALHYTRLLAELAGIIYLRSGHYHVKKTAQKEYQKHGLQAFFKPMLEAATQQFNWHYFDAIEFGDNLQVFWLFMLWRLQSHSDIDQLTQEMAIAFPDLLNEAAPTYLETPVAALNHVMTVRFIERFLEYWGFITLEPSLGSPMGARGKARKVVIYPLLHESFKFLV